MCIRLHITDSVDPGQTPRSVVSDQALHCLLGSVCSKFVSVAILYTHIFLCNSSSAEMLLNTCVHVYVHVYVSTYHC